MDSQSVWARVVQRFAPNSQLLRVWKLSGGVSAQVTALRVLPAIGHEQTWVVRQHGSADLQRNPRIAAHEFGLLRALRTQNINVPQPYFLDEACDIFAAPYLVIECVDGATDLAPAQMNHAVAQLAEQLAAIHQANIAGDAFAALPRFTSGFGARPTLLDHALSEGRIRDQLEKMNAPEPAKPALLHGDFWLGNVLWQGGRICAVLDWEDAALGDPLADLANARLEMLWALGADAMQRFTQRYVALNPIALTHLPYWDLCAALRPAHKLATWGLEPAAEQRMRTQHAWFVGQAGVMQGIAAGSRKLELRK